MLYFVQEKGVLILVYCTKIISSSQLMERLKVKPISVRRKFGYGVFAMPIATP